VTPLLDDCDNAVLDPRAIVWRQRKPRQNGGIMERGARSRRTRQTVPEHRTAIKGSVAKAPKVKPKPQPCDTCATDAYLEWHDAQIPPAFNFELSSTLRGGNGS
jgi:hypothetical protein